MKAKAHKQNIVTILLRVGLAIVFLYAAVSSLQHPLSWAGFLPSFTTKLVDPVLAIRLLAVYEVALAAWLLSGKYVQYGALLCAATLAGIILVNPAQLIITFRDIGLVFAAVALYFAEQN